MPTYYTTNQTTGYYWSTPATNWSTSTTTDCSGYTSWSTYKKSEVKWLTYWMNSLKEPQITEDDILALIEGDD